MNEITTTHAQLPSKIEDLAKFVLIGRDRLTAVRAEIKAIQKVGLAKEVHEQKLAEAQEIADAVLDAEVKIGELTSKMEIAQGQRTDIKPMDNSVPKSKTQQLEQIGIKEKQKQRFETLAKHPQAVEKAKADARAEGRIVTRQDVLDRIVTPKPKPFGIKEAKEAAREEHQQFQEEKKEAVVSIEAIQKDQQNKELIVQETMLKILRAANHASDIMIIPIAELDEMIEEITDTEFKTLSDAIDHGIRTLTKVQIRMEGKRCRTENMAMGSMHSSQKKSDGKRIVAFSS